MRPPPPDISGSCNFSISPSDSANYIDECLTNFGVLDFLDPEVSASFSFDLKYQVTPHIATDGCGILGNLEGNAATINSECSVATKATTILFLKSPIYYLALVKLLGMRAPKLQDIIRLAGVHKQAAAA